MAGEWLKMECATPDKPEVLALTVKLGWDDPDLTVGKLFRLWRWFDQQTTDGNAPNVTPALLDRLIGVTGFVQAVADVGWLTVTADGISLPNFDSHNGATAKSRAQTAKRVANHRCAGTSNAPTVTPALAREEKRREEEEKDSEAIASSSAPAKPRPSRKCPDSFVVTDELVAWQAEKFPGVDWRTETEKLRDYTFKNPITDWVGAWRNWIRRAARDVAAQPRPQQSFRERDAAKNRADIAAWTGGILCGDALPETIDMETRNVLAIGTR